MPSLKERKSFCFSQNGNKFQDDFIQNSHLLSTEEKFRPEEAVLMYIIGQGYGIEYRTVLIAYN